MNVTVFGNLNVLRDFLFTVECGYISVGRRNPPDRVFFVFNFIHPDEWKKDLLLVWGGNVDIRLPIVTSLPHDIKGYLKWVIWDLLELDVVKDHVNQWLDGKRREGSIHSYTFHSVSVDLTLQPTSNRKGLIVPVTFRLNGFLSVGVEMWKVFSSADEVSTDNFQRKVVDPLLRELVETVLVKRFTDKEEVVNCGDPTVDVSEPSLETRIAGDIFPPRHFEIKGIVGPPVEVAERFLHRINTLWSERNWKGLVSYIVNAISFQVVKVDQSWDYGGGRVDLPTTLETLLQLLESLNVKGRL